MIDEILNVTFVISIFTFAFWNILAIWPERKKVFGELPTLTVIMPAHNEGSCIVSTVESVLAADYPKPVEVIVVDDGSTDDTSDKVIEIVKRNRHVKLFNTNHLGKARAVNYGVKNCSTEIVVMLDADSVLDKNGLVRLAEPFIDSKVGAVSGIIRVVLNNNPLVWYQDFEYVLSSMWRYIFDKMGCTYILPGFCAFRRRALEDACGFAFDTLSEDFDIGLKLRKAGWHILMTKSVMHTNVPQTVKGVALQRMRWGRGTFQVIRKHWDMVLNPKHGLIGLYGLPNQIYFFVQGFFIVPITLYQIFNGYYIYFVSKGNILDLSVIKFFVGWSSIFGALELIYNNLTGVWEMSPTFPFFMVSFLLTYFYHIYACVKMDGLKPKLILVLCFFFPYYLFTLLFFIYPMFLELNPFTKASKTNVNIWEKNR